MAKNNQVTTQIIITCNAKNADDEIKRIQKTVTELDDKIAKMRKDGADEKDIKFVENLRNSMNNFSRETVTGFERIKSAIEKLDEQSVNQLRRARRAAQQYRDSLSANDAEYAKAEENLKKINTQIDLLTGKQRRLSDATKNFNGTLQNISTASIDKLNEALKDGEVMLNRMSKGEVERAGVVPGMANIRQEIAKRRATSIDQMRSSVSAITSNGALQNAAPTELTAQISVAKNALDQLPASMSKARQFFVDAIREMQTQLQKLNGTFINTDDFINKTFADMQKKTASPKQLAEAISYIKQKLDELPLSEEKQRAQYTKMMESMLAQTKQVKGELLSVTQLKESVGNLVNNPQALESASPIRISEQIANAKRALDMLPGSSEKMRQFFVAAIQAMQVQLQKLNDTLVDTDKVIDMTYRNMKSGTATPKQLAEAIGLIKSELEQLPMAEEKMRTQYKQMMDEMIQGTKRLSGELKSLEEIRNSVSEVAFSPSNLQKASPVQLSEKIAMAKSALSNLPGVEVIDRSFFTDAIKSMEAQLQSLNGTMVNTDEIINKTRVDMQKGAVTPKQLSESIGYLKQKLDALPASAEKERQTYNKMLADMIQKNKQLRGELTLTQAELESIRGTINSGGIKTLSFEKLREAAKMMRLELSKISESDEKFKALQKDIDKVDAQLNKTTNTVNKHGSAWKTTIKNMMAYVGVFGMLNMVKSKIEEIISLNLKFSQQLADVRKVSGLASNDIKQLGNELSKIDSRTSLQGLMNTAYSGAKLGFGEQGVEGLAQFTRAANVATVAIGEELGEDALPALSKIVENMGIIKKYGIEQSMLKTASAMFKLSSTSTATSNNIVEFSKRLTAMSKVAGITTDQLLALGSASDAMYLSPEVAATAFTKLISSIQTSHNLIEKTLGMTKGIINDLFSRGKAMDAIVQIFEKMHDLGNMNALKPIFKDLGSDGARLMNVMTAMAKNVDMLKKHLDTSAEAFREGTAATAEYNIQQETAEGLMERAKNLWQKAVMNPDEVDVVHEFAKAWYDVSKAVTTSQFAMWNIRTALSSLMGILKALLYLLPSIIAGLGAAGLYRTILGLATGFRVLIAACSHFSFVWKTMSIATKTGWIGLAATAITALISVLGSLYSSASKAKIALDDMNKSVSNSVAEGRKAALEVNEYVKAINKAAIGSNERAIAIKKFNEKFGAYYKNMLTEKSTAKDIAKAYAEVVKHLKEKMLYEGMQKDYEVSVGNRQVSSVYRLQEYDDAYKKTGRTSLHDADWLQAKVKDLRSAGYGSVDKIFKAVIDSVIPTPGFGNNILRLAKSGATPSGISQGWGESDDYFNDRKAGLALYRYIAQEVSSWRQESAFKRRWSRKQGEINDWVSFSSQKDDETPGTLDNDAPDKEAIKAAKAAAAAARKEAREHKQQLQKDLKAADGQVKSFTKAIDAYYTLQEKAIQELYMQGKINEAEMNRYITLMQSKRDMVAAQGRFAIVGDENNFDELRKQMGADYDQFDYSAESNKLLSIIQKADPAATGKLIRNLEGALGTTPDNSMMNDIRNTGVNAQKSESDRRLKLFESADSYLNSKNYLINTGREYDTILSQSGLTDVGLDRGSIIAAGKEPPSRTKVVTNPETGEKETVVLGEPTTTMRQDFIKEGVSHYNVDVNDAEQLRKWLNQFVSQSGKGVLQKDAMGTEYINASDKKDWTTYIPGLQDMLFGIGKDADEKIKILFSTLMQYEEKYYEAKKQQLDYETKILESRWTRSDDYKHGQEKERELEVKSHIQGIYGRGETSAFLNTQEMARNNGFADNIENDPEVEKVKLHMDLARKEAALAQQTSDDKELIRQKDKAAQDAELAYADKINQQIKARIDLLQQWVDPLQEFSEAMGDAFVKMTESAEEGRDAMKEATQNMVKTFAKMTIDMIAQQLKMEVQRALFHKKMLSSETDYQKGMQDANDKGHKSIFKALGSFFKKRKKDKSKAATDENKQEKDTAKKGTDIVKDAANTELKTKTEVAQKGAEVTQQMDQQTSEAKVQTAQTDANTTATETQGNIFAGIASGAAKIIGKLGWWGIPLIAVIQGLLMGLLNSALGKLFGGKQKSSASTNTKLVSGMLTYDSGNVKAFSGAIDKKTYPVVGNDGKVYAAKPTDKLVTGLLTEPVATTVNGVPSIIAERGPEMIIGRETTQALMMARPDIISEIVRFDRNHSGKTYRAYDGGNIAEAVGTLSVPSVSTSQQQVTQAELASFVSTMQALAPVMQAFTRQLQQPLKTSINMYGNGGLYDSMSRASKFMNGRG